MATAITRYVNTASAGGDGTTNGTGGGTAAYASLSAAMDDIGTDYPNFVTSDVQVTVYCTGGADTTAITVPTITTDATRYLAVIGSDTHGGTYNTSVYRLEIPNAYMWRNVGNKISNTRLVNLQFKLTGSSDRSIIDQGGASGTFIVDRCILVQASTSDSYGIAISNTGTGTMRVSNTVIYQTAGSAGIGIETAMTDSGVYVYNVTIVGFATGVYANSAWNGANFFKNVLLSGNTADTSGGANVTWTNCASSGTGVSGTGCRTSQTFTFAGAGDYHLASNDAGAKGFGADLSADSYLYSTSDIDGVARTGTWDIGADQTVGAASFKAAWARGSNQIIQ